MNNITGIEYFLWTALWFMLPAYLGNIAPIFVKWVPFTTPVDFGRSIGKARIFGDHKTWRGIFIGLLVGGIVAILQKRLLIVGLMLSAGNFTGDLAGAFIKRRLSLPPGQKSLIIDSIPSPLFTLFFAFLGGFLTISPLQCLAVILATPLLHIFANTLWHRLRLKDVPW